MKQKGKLKLFIFSMVVICITAVLFFACNSNSIPQYSIEYIAQTGGSITGELIQNVKHGEDGTKVIAIPDEGYEFVKWSDGKTENERLESNVTENITLTAQFERVAYTVEYQTQVGGSISGEAKQSVKYGEDGTEVTAVPDIGYEFVKWSDGITTPERQDNNITVDITVTAVFEKIKLNVTYSANEGGDISGYLHQEVSYGEDAEYVIAIPQTGYRFVKWSDGNGSTIRRETNVTSEISVTAEFEFLFAGGTGNALYPFTIANYTQLNNIWYYPDKSYRLIEDLDLSGILHEPIFNGDKEFNGIFDGNDKTIKNLYIDTDLNFPSLFGVVGGEALIAELNIENAEIITTDYNTERSMQNYYVGIIAGVSMGYLRNINVSGTISVENLSSDGVAIGGCLGMSYGTVISCNANVTINVKQVELNTDMGIAYPFCFGGLIGVCCSSNIDNCYVCGELTVESVINNAALTDRIVLLGGLTAYYFTSEGVERTIKDCQTDIIITSQAPCAGFIGNVGNASNSLLTIKNCYVYGDINVKLRTGGFLYTGNNYGELIIEDCSVLSKLICSNNYASGFLYRFSNSSSSIGMLIKNCTVKSNLSAGSYANGFCANVAHIDFSACSFEGDITSNNYANGFGETFAYCTFEECYAKGNIDGRTFVHGFLKIAYGSVINNCYSSVNLICRNIYEDKIAIVNFVGFASNVMYNSIVSNCYTSSRIISGDTEMELIVDDKNAVFIGTFRQSEILNCHALVEEDSLVQNLIFNTNINDDVDVESLDITTYAHEEDMYFLADVLNNKSDSEIWVNVVNSCPSFAN